MLNRTLGHYRIVERIGAGGMGAVYRAWDERLERDVAVKVILPSLLTGDLARRRFRREALALSKLNHQNIAVVHDFDSEDGVDFLVMEYIPGTSLHDRLRIAALPEKDVLFFGAQIASALEEAHERGVIHRDLKPANIRITQKNQLKVLDFGLAQLIQFDAHLDTTVLRSEIPTAGGTVPYMAPEQLRDEAVDVRSDIYSLGAILYEMATGRRAFPENQGPRLIDSVLNHPCQPPSELTQTLSAELERITLKCLEKDPQNRYQSAREIGVDIRRLGSAGSVTSAPGRPVARARPPSAPTRRALTVAAAVMVVVAAAFALRGPGWPQRIGLGSSAPDELTIVALPGKVTGGPDDAFLGDAIPATLSAHLAQVEGLRTKMPPSRVDMEAMGGDIAKTAKAYGAQDVIVSSVAVDGDRVVLEVRVVEAATRHVLWSRTFEGQRQRYVDLVRLAAEGVRLAVRPSARSIAAAAATAEQSQAELSFQLGAYYGNLFLNSGRTDYFDRAVAALQQSLERDPGRADAAGRIASLYADKVVAGAADADVSRQAKAWADRALAIDSRASRAWAVLANLESSTSTSSQRKALEYALKGVTANPQDTYALQRLVSILGRDSYALAADASRVSSDADPLVMVGPVFESLTRAVLADYDAAIDRIDHALTLNPDFPFGLQTRTIVLTMANRRPDEVRQLLSRLDQLVAQRRLHPAWVAFAHAFADFSQGALAHNDEMMRSALQKLSAMAHGEPPFPRWQSITLGVAAALARFGQREEAAALLNWRSGAGVLDPYDVLLFQPDLKPILKDIAPALVTSRARFDESIGILQEARLRAELPVFLDDSLKRLLGRIAAAQR